MHCQVSTLTANSTFGFLYYILNTRHRLCTQNLYTSRLHTYPHTSLALGMRAAARTCAGIEVQGAVETTAAVGHGLGVVGVPIIFAERDGVARCLREVLLEQVENRIEGIADARFATEPGPGVVCDREVLVFASGACVTAGLLCHLCGLYLERH